MPARTRRFTPSSDRAPRRMASQYLTLGDLLTAADHRGVGGFSFYQRLSGGKVHLTGTGISRRSAMKSSFSAAPSFSAASPARYRPMAGGGGQAGGLDAHGLEEAVGALTHDEVAVRAVQMGAKPGEAGDDIPHGGGSARCATLSPPRGAGPPPWWRCSPCPPDPPQWGPTSRLPWTVGVTSTPLPMAEGSWKIVCRARPPSRRSSRQYSPRRGTMCS